MPSRPIPPREPCQFVFSNALLLHATARGRTGVVTASRTWPRSTLTAPCQESQPSSRPLRPPPGAGFVPVGANAAAGTSTGTAGAVPATTVTGASGSNGARGRPTAPRPARPSLRHRLSAIGRRVAQCNLDTRLGIAVGIGIQAHMVAGSPRAGGARSESGDRGRRSATVPHARPRDLPAGRERHQSCAGAHRPKARHPGSATPLTSSDQVTASSGRSCQVPSGRGFAARKRTPGARGHHERVFNRFHALGRKQGEPPLRPPAAGSRAITRAFATGRWSPGKAG